MQQRPKILLVDDEPEFVEALQKTLQRNGYDIVTAYDGLQGLHKALEEPPDLILLDIIMPEKEGLETIIELRKKYSSTRIIAISGGGRSLPESYLDLAHKLGARYTFTKPIDRKELLAAVDDLLPN